MLRCHEADEDNDLFFFMSSTREGKEKDQEKEKEKEQDTGEEYPIRSVVAVAPEDASDRFWLAILQASLKRDHHDASIIWLNNHTGNII